MAALAVIALLGCSGPPDRPAPTPTPSSASAQSATVAQELLDRLLPAARSGDQTAFQALLSNRDPVFADRARQWFDNLSGLPLTQLQARLGADRAPLTEPRRELLGAEAWTQVATLTWRLAGDSAAADHQVWFTFVPDGATVRLAGLIDRPTGSVTRQPSWWLGPVQAGRQAAVTVVVGAGQPLATWERAASGALSQVRQRLPSTAGAAKNPTLVLEVPATTADFERVVGAQPGSYAGVAAVTLAEGESADAALRVVVNPEAARRLTADGLGVTLTHETVHVLARSPQSPAPSWAVEGLADWIALRAYPKAAPAVAAPLQREVRAAGAPSALPGNAAFAVDAPRLDLAYAQAWSVCRYVVATSSPADLGRLYAELDRGRTLDQATQAVLGVSAAEFTEGWRRYRRTDAGR